MTPEKNCYFFPATLLHCYSQLFKYGCSAMAESSRGAQDRSFEAWFVLAKYFQESHNQLISLAMVKIC